MTGRKSLAEVRAELEAALGSGPAGAGPVAESLRRFLAAGAGGGEPTSPPRDNSPQPETPRRRGAAKRGRSAAPRTP